MRVTGLVLMIVLAGCAGASGPSTGPGKSSTGLTGVRVESADCAATWPDPGTKTDDVTGSTVEFTVCGSSPRPHDPNGVQRPLQGTVEQYTAAFSRPDTRPQGTVSCLAYADVPPNVIVRTTTGYWSLHIPLDECDHLQPAVKRLLT